MKRELIFRRANLKDLKDILRLNFELFKLEHKKYDKSLNMNWTYKEGKNSFRKSIIGKNNFVEVIEFNGKIIGYLNGGTYKGLPWFQKAVYAEIFNMFILGRYRRKNLGKKIVKDFLDWCKGKKVNYVNVVASFGNRNAIVFYNRSKFKGCALILRRKISKK